LKPRRIILVRHGQSEGNVNREVYTHKPDYAVHLTELGRRQAHDVGKFLKELIGNEEGVKFYTSPFWRARETTAEIKKWFEPNQLHAVYEDPRLREQEWGHKSGQPYIIEHERERDRYGRFYWRFTDGESCADVYDRISDFLNTLFRDFTKENFPENAIIVNHGMSMRLFLMRWLHLTVEEFESIKNPKNCGYFILERNKNDKYDLITPYQTYEKPTHNFQFPKYTPLPKD
jgi:broad specificity phosphatase PhoE